MGAPVLTVRTRLFYARKELCDLMGEEPALAAFAARFASAKDTDVAFCANRGILMSEPLDSPPSSPGSSGEARALRV
ncbi:MAG: hypothetical protein U0165_16355 [Polyangiaceae bacterium]